MSKKIIHVLANNDKIYSIEVYQLYNNKEILLSIGCILECPERYMKIINEKDDRIIIFTIPEYFKKQNNLKPTIQSFEESVNDIKKYIQDIDRTEIFYFWIKSQEKYIWNDMIVLNGIIKKYKMNDEIKDNYKNFIDGFKDDIIRMKKKCKDNEKRMIEIMKDICKREDIIKFQIKKIKISCPINLSDHSLYYYMDNMILSKEWNLFHYNNMVRWDPKYPLKILDEYEYNTDSLTILNNNNEEMIEIYTDRVDLDMYPTKMDHVKNELEKIYPLFQEITEYKQIAVSGFFYYKNKVFNKLIWQDFCMNDPIASRYILINELEKATKYGENIYMYFEKDIRAIMINSENDVYPKISEIINEQYIRVNVIRASNEDEIQRFQTILCSLLQRFYRLYPEYISSYEKYISLPSLSIEPEEKIELSNFRNRYKHILKNIGYTITCRPKDRIPKIITKEEAKGINPLYKIIYPKKENDNLAIDIPREYLTCPSKEFIYPGIISLSGGNIYVPCCFNKNQRSSKAYTEYYSEKKTETKVSEHIKSENQIIKTFGDLGRLPGKINNFLSCQFPWITFLRCGTMDNEESILYSLSYLTKKDMHGFIKTIRGYLSCGRQENPYMDNKEIEEEIDRKGYIDPRKYIRYLEEYYNVNIILFSKSKNNEMIDILVPNHVEYYLRFRMDPSKKFVFLYEHWGSSPDRYTKRMYPVCEMIVGVDGSSKVQDLIFELTKKQTDDLEKIYGSIFLYYGIQTYNVVSFYKYIRGQYIDKEGKTRGLYIRYHTQEIYMEIIGVYPPLVIFDEEEIKIIRCDYELLKEFCKEYRIDIFDIYNYKKDYFVRIKDNNGYEYHVLIKQPTNIKNIIRMNVIPMMIGYTNYLLEEEIYNERLARVMIDTVLWLYHKKKVSIHEFIQKHVEYREGYNYSRELDENVRKNPSIMSNDKIYINNKIMHDKIRFILLYNQKLEGNGDIMNNFYRYPMDFRHSKQIYTRNVFDRIIKYSDNEIRLEDVSLQKLKKIRGYWYKYDEMPRYIKCPFLYMEIKTEEEGTSLSIFWNKYHYIPDHPIHFTDPLINITRYRDNEWTYSNDNQEYIIYMVYTEINKLYVLLPI